MNTVANMKIIATEHHTLYKNGVKKYCNTSHLKFTDQKMNSWKMQDWKMQMKFLELKMQDLANGCRNFRGRKCTTLPIAVGILVMENAELTNGRPDWSVFPVLYFHS